MCISVVGQLGKTSNSNRIVNSRPRSTKLSHNIDPSDPYWMMMSLGHAHFWFRFPGRLHFSFFAYCSLTPNHISKITSQTCGRRGCPKIQRDKLGHLPPIGGLRPNPKFHFSGSYHFLQRLNFDLPP